VEDIDSQSSDINLVFSILLDILIQVLLNKAYKLKNSLKKSSTLPHRTRCHNEQKGDQL